MLSIISRVVTYHRFFLEVVSKFFEKNLDVEKKVVADSASWDMCEYFLKPLFNGMTAWERNHFLMAIQALKEGCTAYLEIFFNLYPHLIEVVNEGINGAVFRSSTLREIESLFSTRFEAHPKLMTPLMLRFSKIEKVATELFDEIFKTYLEVGIFEEVKAGIKGYERYFSENFQGIDLGKIKRGEGVFVDPAFLKIQENYCEVLQSYFDHLWINQVMAVQDREGNTLIHHAAQRNFTGFAIELGQRFSKVAGMRNKSNKHFMQIVCEHTDYLQEVVFQYKTFEKVMMFHDKYIACLTDQKPILQSVCLKRLKKLFHENASPVNAFSDFLYFEKMEQRFKEDPFWSGQSFRGVVSDRVKQGALSFERSRSDEIKTAEDFLDLCGRMMGFDPIRKAAIFSECVSKINTFFPSFCEDKLTIVRVLTRLRKLAEFDNSAKAQVSACEKRMVAKLILDRRRNFMGDRLVKEADYRHPAAAAQSSLVKR